MSKQNFTTQELIEVYKILKLIKENLIINPSENWESDYYDEKLINKSMLNNLLTKLKNILPENEIKEQEKEVLIRKYSNWNNELDEKVYSKVENSFNKGKTIQIGYFDMGSAEINKREIDVYHKTRRYVIGYCHLRKAMRKFRTSRIISAKITDKSYQIPQDFDKNEY